MFNVDTFKVSILVAVITMGFLFSSCSTTNSYSHRNRKKNTRYSKPQKPRTQHSTKHIDSNDELRNQLIGTAKKYIGTKYVYGGKKPNGFDCSGFITWVMNKNGINLQGSSSMIAKKGVRKRITDLESGDLVFFGSGNKVTHIALVVENQKVLKVIHSTSSRGVVIDDVSGSAYWSKRYLFGKSII